MATADVPGNGKHDTIPVRTARRIALAAQGFADRRPAVGARVDIRHVRRALARVGVVQIDSVNVLVRSHELPLFSRLGPHPRDLLPRLAYGPFPKLARPETSGPSGASGTAEARRSPESASEARELFEYWAHQASYAPVSLQPMLRWRMARAGSDAWGRMTRMRRDHPGLVESVLAEVKDRGPLAASELTDGGRGTGSWWGWGKGKTALEYLFWAGEVTAAGRRGNFERVYDLTERVLPSSVLAAPTPDETEAKRALLHFSAARLGIGTARDLADYFRIGLTQARLRIGELVEEGLLTPVRVQGWRDQAFLHPEAAVPVRALRSRALLSPFDSLVWERSRVERLFGMRLRLEIYTPAHKRVHGYYVLPFLLGEQLVARVDLKADRKGGRLLAPGVHSEAAAEGHSPASIAGPLAAELADLAAWLGLDRGIVVGGMGDLAPALATEVTALGLAAGALSL